MTFSGVEKSVEYVYSFNMNLYIAQSAEHVTELMYRRFSKHHPDHLEKHEFVKAVLGEANVSHWLSKTALYNEGYQIY